MTDKKKLAYVSVIGVILLAGLALRLVFALSVPTGQHYDFATYKQLALNIKDGLGHTSNGKPVAWQGPLYPYLLGFFYRLTGTDSDAAGKTLNIILSMLTLGACIPLYNKLLGSKNRAAAALALTALLPQNAAYVNVLGTETVFTFLLVITLLCFVCFDKKRLYPVIGVLAGLMALTKPFMLAFPAVLALAFLIKNRKLKETAAFAGIVLGCAFAVVAPWTARNYVHYRRFIPVSYNGGYVSYINFNGKNQNGLWMDALEAAEDEETAARIEEFLAEAGEGGVKAAPDLEPYLSEKAGEWIFNNPIEAVKLGFLHVAETFFGGADDVPQWAMNEAEYVRDRDRIAVESGLRVILNLLSAAGVFFVIKTAVYRPEGGRDWRDWLVSLCLLFFAAVIFGSEGQARYAFPLFPLFICGAVKLIIPSAPRPICPAPDGSDQRGK